MTSRRMSNRKRFAIGAAVAGLGLTAVAASGTVAPGTPAKDITRGADNDNVANAFIQPPGVAANLSMNNTDVLFGRGNDDLLIGNKGGDTLVAGPGHDIMIGGPENFVAPNSDVMLGDEGNDINIWAPGDGSDAFVGDRGHDTMVFAPLVTNPNGSPKLEWYGNRKVPRVDISDQSDFSCDIVRVPAGQHFGAQFLVRFEVNGTPVVSVRQKDVETLLCPTGFNNRAAVADLTAANPQFAITRLVDVPGTLGAIVAKP